VAYSKARFKTITMKQLLFQEQYEQAAYQIFPDYEFATGFIEGQFCERQQFHWYSRLIENVAHKLTCNRIIRFINKLHTLPRRPRGETEI
jgi:hypothetical protein